AVSALPSAERGEVAPDAAEPAAPAVAAGSDAEAALIEQIDQMLADQADGAIEGDFATVSEVLESELGEAGREEVAAAAAEGEPEQAGTGEDEVHDAETSALEASSGLSTDEAEEPASNSQAEGQATVGAS